MFVSVLYRFITQGETVRSFMDVFVCSRRREESCLCGFMRCSSSTRR